jgi:early secretory antigenic target protein ESAT-6
MSEQTWNFAAIEAASSAIQGSVGTTAGFLAEGKESLLNLAAAWGGSGSEAYQAVQARWDATSAELNTSLNNLSIRVTDAKDAMQLTEKGVGNLFGG